MLCAVHTVLKANEAYNSKHRCLICTPSHTASDVVTRRLGKFLSKNELFRLYDVDRPIETVPVDVLGFCRQSDDQTGVFVLPDVPILMQFQVIVCTCSDAHLLYRIGFTNQQLRIRRQCFETYMQKCCEGTNLRANIEGVHEPHFTHLFIDEAAQATEPETLIPLSVVLDPDGPHRKVEIALVGDPRQLSPSVYSVEAASVGLERSWMERLLHRPVSCLGGGSDDMLGPDFAKIEDWLHYSLLGDGHDQLSFFLTLNYRGHPSFLMMPSAMFYSDKLSSVEHQKDSDQGETFWCAKIRHIESLSDPVIMQNEDAAQLDEPDEVKCRKQFSWPLHFRGVVGRDVSVTVESGFASNSWENSEEAKCVVEMCSTLVTEGVSSSSIGVMAPFRGQVVLIRRLLRKKRLGGINVGTIEDYQSVEFDVILLSLVRSAQSFVEHDIRHRMGVFGQPKRSNVALTRAEFLLIVVSTYFCRRIVYQDVPPVFDSQTFRLSLMCRLEIPMLWSTTVFGSSFYCFVIEMDCTTGRNRIIQLCFVGRISQR
jgi:AAA domain